MFVIDIYTDGASKGNPGPAGYGWVAIGPDRQKLYRSYGVKYATNNQMELTAVIDALKTILDRKDFVDGSFPVTDITIFSDSQYVCNAFNKHWIKKWIKEDYKKIKNPELWRELVDLKGRVEASVMYATINFMWVKGHNGNELNEEADNLAQMACGHEGIVMQGFKKTTS